MKKIVSVVLPALLLLVMPFGASAHEHASFKIGGVTYNLVVGSLHEPIAVDDKTGVEFAVTKGGNAHGEGGVPVVGLEETLKVELIAGDKKKVLDFSPTWGEKGAYQAGFYPTVATTLSYRIFGTIEEKPFDVTFTCLAEGVEATDVHESKDIGGGITQVSRGGGFGCPAPKEDLGFPEQSASVATLEKEAKDAGGMGTAGVGLGVVALLLAGYAVLKKKNI